MSTLHDYQKTRNCFNAAQYKGMWKAEMMEEKQDNLQPYILSILLSLSLTWHQL